jgi:predicted nucleic acid-binding protein
MRLFIWDASALAKRYFAETGSDTVNAIFTSVPTSEMATTSWGYLETYSILVRRRNGGVLDPSTFSTIITALQQEIVDSPDFHILPMNDEDIFTSVGIVVKHNLNATDAAILTAIVKYSKEPGIDECFLIAADKRLTQAAEHEGIRVINPEVLSR